MTRRAAAIITLLVGAVVALWSLASAPPVETGPLRGFDDVAIVMSSGAVPGSPIEAGTIVTFGCQALRNEGDDVAVIDEIDLLGDHSGAGVRGPFVAPAGPTHTLVCSEFGPVAEQMPDAVALPDDGWRLDPGEDVAVVYEIVFDATEDVRIDGHRVWYRSAGKSYVEEFASALVLCRSPDDAACAVP